MYVLETHTHTHVLFLSLKTLDTIFMIFNYFFYWAQIYCTEVIVKPVFVTDSNF